MATAAALKIYNENNEISARLEGAGVGRPGAGEVTFRTAFSSVNYKDALAVTGSGKVMRRFPLVAGIDAAGTVIESADARYQPGQAVICTSYDMGVNHDGGFAQECRVPAEWIVPLPDGLTLFDAMALGTAGYTAGLAVELLELNGLAPGNGPVLINGATGGVGTLLIDMLAGRGFNVVAVTGKRDQQEYLRALGAAQVLDRTALEAGTRPLEKAQWAAAFDSVGGTQLAGLIRTMQPHGLIASIGNAGGIEFSATVLPFILRGVRLIGVDSAYTPMPLRRKVWQRLATDLKPGHLAAIASTIGLDDLAGYCAEMVAGRIRGRAVVKLS